MPGELYDVLNLGELPVDVRAIHYHQIKKERNEEQIIAKEYLSTDKLSKALEA